MLKSLLNQLLEKLNISLDEMAVFLGMSLADT